MNRLSTNGISWKKFECPRRCLFYFSLDTPVCILANTRYCMNNRGWFDHKHTEVEAKLAHILQTTFSNSFLSINVFYIDAKKSILAFLAPAHYQWWRSLVAHVYLKSRPTPLQRKECLKIAKPIEYHKPQTVRWQFRVYNGNTIPMRRCLLIQSRPRSRVLTIC